MALRVIFRRAQAAHPPRLLVARTFVKASSMGESGCAYNLINEAIDLCSCLPCPDTRAQYLRSGGTGGLSSRCAEGVHEGASRVLKVI
jgi:hypothetical protein